MFRELRWRLVAWYVALLASILILFSAGVFGMTRAVLLKNLDEVLSNQAALLTQAVDIEHGVPVLEQDVLLAGHPNDDQFTRLFSQSGALVFDDTGDGPAVPPTPAVIRTALTGQPGVTQVRTAAAAVRVATYPVVHDGAVAGVLQVGVAMDDVERTLQTLLTVLLLLIPATTVLAGGGGLFLAQRALAPIDRITRTAQRISAENLSGRIALRGPDDEVGRLARTFDTMLARLEAAFTRQRQFAADASHELRTPLTAIIGQIDVALGWPASAEHYRQTLVAVRGQAERLTRLALDLLFLARSDAQTRLQRVERLDLADMLAAVVEELRPLAAERGQQLALASAGPSVVVGDEDYLIRLFLNLVDNAIRYSPRAAQIRVGVAAAGDSCAVAVQDTGPGIPERDLPHIFDRFYRIDHGRNRARGGAGLGLAIAQSIAELHGGRIAVASAVGRGSTFTVYLPRVEAGGRTENREPRT